MQNEKESFFTVKEASQRLGMPQTKIYTILHYDRLEHEKIGGRIVIREKTLNDYQQHLNNKSPVKEKSKKENKKVKEEKVEKNTDNKEKESKK